MSEDQINRILDSLGKVREDVAALHEATIHHQEQAQRHKREWADAVKDLLSTNGKQWKAIEGINLAVELLKKDVSFTTDYIRERRNIHNKELEDERKSRHDFMKIFFSWFLKLIQPLIVGAVSALAVLVSIRSF